MQIKTISKTIQNKLNEWLDTIYDAILRAEIKENILVSGGSITSMLLNEPVNDYDIYIIDKSVLIRLVQYYTKSNQDIEILDGANRENLISVLQNKYGGIEIAELNNIRATSLRNLKGNQVKLYFESKSGGLKIEFKEGEEIPRYTPIFFSPNAISLSNQIQIVIRFHGDNKAIHETFDFIHATNYFTFKDGLVTNIAALESILTKQLKYQGSQYPVTSIIRAKKFIKRGWNINAGEYLKIMFQISQLDLSNPDVLEEQLVGVDVAYFAVLIEALRNKFNSDKDFKLTNEYFNKLIDKIFNETETED